MNSSGYRGVDLGQVVDNAAAASTRDAQKQAPPARTPEPEAPANGATRQNPPERIDLTQYDQEPAQYGSDGLTDEERSGQYRTGPIDPNRPTAPRRLMRGGEQLSVMVGRRLLVGITFLDESGNVTNAQQFCGRVLEVADGVVVVERPGEPEPAVLPADVAAYRKAQTGRYTLRDTGQIVIDPDFVSTWQVAAVDG
ncbi:hypothetical protein LWF15_05460 [Kineosporia rhizophila]|uniref:hypothetical protein n=1 Tax=Kineosporia TaxID=49184 RepID=UPI001E3D5074|nr:MULTISPECIES: hypothetical protein [Kineosporia]MCE0534950.1 hypothetical protein [Kineosporia rhizophila]GLY14769.1 hypothetical protein Kisp01_17840 [Kineosporia sp. NBRC 101677]